MTGLSVPLPRIAMCPVPVGQPSTAITYRHDIPLSPRQFTRPAGDSLGAGERASWARRAKEGKWRHWERRAQGGPDLGGEAKPVGAKG